MNHWKTLALLLLLYLICLLPQGSDAEAPKNQAQDAKPLQQASPSPSPDPGISKSNSGDGKGDAKLKPTVVPQETCDLVPIKCHDDAKNVTACILPYAGHGPLGLLVLNNGNSSLKLNVTVLPVKATVNNTEVLGHQVKKITVSSDVSESSSIILDAVNWTCTLPRGVPVPGGFPSYTAYVTPINGAYLLFATVLLIGGTWACCKLGKNGRHLDGVPYQELEMGQRQSVSSMNVATTDGWDESWDDDWDEENAIKSPSRNHGGNGLANGVSSRYADTNGWGEDWNG